MKRPSKLRVLLAVNLWRIRHKRTPILYLPKGTPGSASTCPLGRATGRHIVWGVWDGFMHGYALSTDGDKSALTPTLSEFGRHFDAGLYPELIA